MLLENIDCPNPRKLTKQQLDWYNSQIFDEVTLVAPPRDDIIFFTKNGGGRGIRTPARFDPPVGFQDRSLQPDLGIPPKI
jgi:hypothetical protein